MEQKLRVVLVGCGGMSGAWLRTAGERCDVNVVGLVDINEAAAAQRKQEFGLVEAVTGTNLEKVMDAVKPEAVWNCTIPEAHAEVTLSALAHGCHVLSEKPLADSMENAGKMVRAAQQAGKIFAIIQNRRYDPQIRGFRDFLASGAIGPLTTLNSDFYIGAHFGGFRDRMEHVLLLDMAIHSFDQARLISGADPMAVYCHEWNPAGSWYDHDASAIAIFEMTGGLIYTYRGSWCSEGLNTTWECDWRAVGSHGSALWNGGDQYQAQQVAHSNGFHSDMVDVPIGPTSGGKHGGHAGLIGEFIECVRNGGVPETTAEDNIKSLAMVFGAIESAQTGKRVEIHLPKLG
jgi:predicted dehydrogenase